MIYTITTNPSLDYTVETELIPGQVNRTRSEVIYPGGKGINVSISLQRLGQETRVLGFAAGRIGQTIRDLLDDLGRGPDLGEAEMAKRLELLREVGTEDAVVLSGWAQSIPFYVSILQQVVATGCMTVLDCTGESLWQCLGCRPFLVKPNLMELGALFGVEDLDETEGVELARQLQHEGARNVLVSMGRQGAFLLTEEQELYFANACIGQVRNTVGAGDSLVAGFLTGLRQSGDFGRALQMGVAAGCATAFDDWLGTRENTLALLEQIREQKWPRFAGAPSLKIFLDKRRKIGYNLLR